VDDPPVDVDIEKPHVHHKRVGHDWFDLALPVAALFVSFVSIFIAWHHGEVMKELVHQNERLVEANSLPFVQLYSNNGPDHFTLVAGNSGVGPAQIRSAILLVDGRPMPSLADFLETCCAMKDRQNVSKANLRGAMIRAGQDLPYLEATAGSAALRPLLGLYDAHRIETRVCYCSVFGDCWVRSSFDTRLARDPQPVKACPIGPSGYRD
jgi:hypothetical protein